jgi:hypothetical protein
MAPDGRVYVIEINPLPGLTPDFSDLCTIAQVAGMNYHSLIGEILAGCLKRHREARSRPPRQAEPQPAPTPQPATTVVGATVGTNGT